MQPSVPEGEWPVGKVFKTEIVDCPQNCIAGNPPRNARIEKPVLNQQSAEMKVFEKYISLAGLSNL